MSVIKWKYSQCRNSFYFEQIQISLFAFFTQYLPIKLLEFLENLTLTYFSHQVYTVYTPFVLYLRISIKIYGKRYCTFVIKWQSSANGSDKFLYIFLMPTLLEQTGEYTLGEITWCLWILNLWKENNIPERIQTLRDIKK